MQDVEISSGQDSADVWGAMERVCGLYEDRDRQRLLTLGKDDFISKTCGRGSKGGEGRELRANGWNLLARIEWRSKKDRNTYIVESYLSAQYLVHMNITKYSLKKGKVTSVTFSSIWTELLNLFFI